MLTAILGTALALGFLGSIHCALMCGPLAVVGCGVRGEPNRRELLHYFAGRLVSYSFMGALFGVLGAEARHLVAFDTMQRGLLVIVAVLSLVRGLTLLLPGTPPTGLIQIKTRQALSRWTTHFARLVPRRGLTFGLVTGGLPCGLLAGAWALAASSGSPLGGALTMAVFFVATSPALLAGVLLAKPFGRRISPALQGVLWCAMAIWIGLRPVVERTVHHCH